MSPLVKTAANVLAERTVVAPADDSAQRARGIETIQRALRERAARKKRTRIALVASVVVATAAAAAVILAIRPNEAASRRIHPTRTVLASTDVTITATTVDPDVTITRSPNSPAVALAAGDGLAVGGRILAARGAHALLGFSTGTSLELDGGDLSVVDESALQRFDLHSGAVVATVVHLVPGRRFVIGTPDADVEVHGTKFRVTVVPPADACADGSRTRVSVTERVVVVRTHGHEDRVAAGTSWPSACAAIAAPSVAHPLASTASASSASVAAALSASTLSAQNDLFADAMTAKRGGDKVRAVAILDVEARAIARATKSAKRALTCA